MYAGLQDHILPQATVADLELRLGNTEANVADLLKRLVALEQLSIQKKSML